MIQHQEGRRDDERVAETMFSKIFGERNLTKTSKYYFKYYFLDNFV
jgi:hypothetical protein